MRCGWRHRSRRAQQQGHARVPAAGPRARGAVLPREDARDAVCSPTAKACRGRCRTSCERLGQSPRIGTSSVRRTAQLTRLFPGARFAPIRGNLDTRLRKLDAGEFDALILAAAGLIRLGYERRISAALAPDACVPAPGQGIIAVEVRSDDTTTRGIAVHDRRSRCRRRPHCRTRRRRTARRRMPDAHRAVRGRVRNGLVLTAVVVSVDGARTARTETRGPRAVRSWWAPGPPSSCSRMARPTSWRVDTARGAVEGLQP